MAFDGSCHCGAVEFTVDGDTPTQAMSCNCSHCRRKGFLLAFVPASSMTVNRGQDALTDYFFNRHSIAHSFCNTCGCQPFGKAKGPDGVEMAAVNLRCVPAIDLDALTIEKVDGASF